MKNEKEWGCSLQLTRANLDEPDFSFVRDRGGYEHQLPDQGSVSLSQKQLNGQDSSGRSCRCRPSPGKLKGT